MPIGNTIRTIGEPKDNGGFAFTQPCGCAGITDYDGERIVSQHCEKHRIELGEWLATQPEYLETGKRNPDFRILDNNETICFSASHYRN